MQGEPLNGSLLQAQLTGAETQPMTLTGGSAIWLAATRLREAAEDPELAEDNTLGPLLDALLDAAAAMEQQLIDQRTRIDQLECLSITDELTGLLNRRGFHIEIDRALARARRNDERGLLVICDLDQFKSVNDRFGHLAGDFVLRSVGQALRGCTRSSDYLARLGGDEFAVLMTDTQPHRAIRLAHKLSDRINGLVVTWQNIEIPVAASLGAQPYNKDITAARLHALADNAMYECKRGDSASHEVSTLELSRLRSGSFGKHTGLVATK